MDLGITAKIRRATIQMTLLLAAGAALVSGAQAADSAPSGPKPILLELFTSEGCSSCPPVDIWAARLDHFQPVKGDEVIVLSEHVTYWDHDGWKDPFSSDRFTARQQGYETILGLGDAYTPQVILNGAEVVNVAGPEEQIRQSFEKAALINTVPLQLSGVTLEPGDSGLTGKLMVDGSQAKHGGEVWVAVALNRVDTDVLAGENGGRKLVNVAVVKEMEKVGKLEKGKSLNVPFTMQLWPGADPVNLRVVAFVQQGEAGHVLGAAMTQQIAGSAPQTRPQSVN